MNSTSISCISCRNSGAVVDFLASAADCGLIVLLSDTIAMVCFC